MARTKSQKAKRYAAKTAKRLAAAQSTRAAINHEAVLISSMTRATYMQSIQQGAESAHAQRVRLHHERVNYVAGDDDIMIKHTRCEVLPLVRIQATTRADAKRKIAARVLQTYHREAKAQGISKAEMLRHFKAERPGDALLLNLI